VECGVVDVRKPKICFVVVVFRLVEDIITCVSIVWESHWQVRAGGTGKVSVASLIIRDEEGGDSLGSPEGLQWVKHREGGGSRLGLGWSQLTWLGLWRPQLRRLSLGRSPLRRLLWSGLKPAVKLSKLRLPGLQLWRDSQLRSLLRSGLGSSTTESSEGGRSLTLS